MNGEVKQWRQLPLDPLCPLLFFDALRVRIRDGGSVRNKAVRLALGIRMDPARQVLGLWIEQDEGARFRLQVMSELKGRGMQDCLIAVADGLKGFPQAMRSAFPEAGGPDLHRASDAARAQPVLLPRAPRDGPPCAGDLPCRQRRGRRRPPG